MNHLQINSISRYGHASFGELQEEIMQENKYIEDIYEEEISIGDTYYVDGYGQLIHEKSLAKYALDYCDLKKETR